MANPTYPSLTFTIPQKGADPRKAAFQQLQRAEAFRLKGELDRAQALCEPLVAQHPTYFGALYTLGMIYADRRKYPQALGLLVRAVMQHPKSWKALTALSAVYLELGASELAAQTLESAARINPGDPAILATLGEIYRTEREYELAYEAYLAAVDIDPTLQIAQIGLGLCCMHLGRFERAAQTFESLVKAGHRSLVALTALSEIPPALVSLDIIAEIGKAQREDGISAEDFARGKAIIQAAALDRQNRPDEAWPLLRDANRAIYAARQNEARHLSEAEQASLNLAFANPPAAPAARAAETMSLFILGPSRSGKSTMETMLASLKGVKRGYESPIVENAVRQTFQSAGLLADTRLNALPGELDDDFRELYLTELTRRARGAALFTNTHPIHIHDAARLAAIIPGTRFVFVKRDIDDNLLRIFMRRYSIGNHYSYDLAATRAHLTWYHAMMDRLAEMFPDIVRVIQYEDMVTDPAQALRMGAELCGLDAAGATPSPIGDDRNCAGPYRQWIAATAG